VWKHLHIRLSEQKEYRDVWGTLFHLMVVKPQFPHENSYKAATNLMENRCKSQHFWEKMACLALSWWSEWMDTKDSTWPRWRAQPKCCGWGEVFTFLGTKPSHMFSSCLFLSLQLFDIPEIPYHFPIYREFLGIYIYIHISLFSLLKSTTFCPWILPADNSSVLGLTSPKSMALTGKSGARKPWGDWIHHEYHQLKSQEFR